MAIASTGGAMDAWDIDDENEMQSPTNAKHRKLASTKDKKDEMVLKILQLLTKFGLKIGLDARELQAAALLTTIAPTDHEYFEAARAKKTAFINGCKAAKETPTKQKPKGPLHTHIWAALTKSAITDPKSPKT